MKKINIAIVSTLLIWSCNLSNEKVESQCNCPIVESLDKKMEKGKGNSDQTWAVGSNGDVEAVVKKAVDAKISISGSYSNSNSKIEEVYREIIGSNPKITQKANLYRSVACAYYEIACQDKTLNDKDKSNKLNEVVAGYERNINKIISEEVSARDEIKSNLTTESLPRGSTPQEVFVPNNNDLKSNNTKDVRQTEPPVEEKEKVLSRPVPVICTFQKDPILFECLECGQTGQNIICTFRITSLGEDEELNTYGLGYAGSPDSKIIDEEGNDFAMVESRLANVSGTGAVTKKLVANVPITAKFTFSKVTRSVKMISMLEIKSSLPNLNWFTAEFRNIPVVKK